MCFSAGANFVAAGVLTGIGVATLRHVDHPKSALFATMPLLFALHQFTDAFVWLGLDGRIGRVALDHSAFLFMLYAQGVLPLLMPLAVLLMEPPGWRRQVVGVATLVGTAVCLWVTYGVVAIPSRVFVDHHSIAYRNPLTDNSWVAGAYVLSTCGALVASGHRTVRWFGVLNIIGLTIVIIVRGYAFTSVWCLYAAVLSAMIYWQFSKSFVEIETPNRRLPDALSEWQAFRRAIGID